MIHCVGFETFERLLIEQGFRRNAETERHYLHTRDRDLVTVRKPNENGELTLREVDAVGDAADLKPPRFDAHWCD